MKVDTKQIGSVVVAHLVGEIDSVDSESLGEALAEIVAAKPANLVLDFEGVNYIASVGLSLLLKVAQEMRKHKGGLAIAAVTPAVKTVLDTVQLGSAIMIVPTVEAALVRLKARTPIHV